MALPALWIAIDVIGTSLSGDIFVHSASGERVSRPLRRCASQLGFSRAGEAAFRSIVAAALADRELPALDGLVIETHRVDAADGTRVGLIVWASASPAGERPVYNAWVLDLATMTTRTSGDDPAMIGDGRRAGEQRSIQSLLTWLNPDDAWTIVGIFYDALTGDDGLLIEGQWSVRPAGADWVHMWTAGRLRVSEDNQRLLHGLTVKLVSREINANIAMLVRYSGATLLLVEALYRIPLTSVGRMAPLSEDHTAQVLAQLDQAKLSCPTDPDGAVQAITIDGEPFTASIFPLSSARLKYGGPVAVVLFRSEEADDQPTTAPMLNSRVNPLNPGIWLH